MSATLLKLLLLGLGRLPMPVLRALGGAGGELLWWTHSSQRRVSEQHLDRLFPDARPEQRRRLARLSLHAFVTAVAESPAIWFGRETRLRQWLHQPEAAARLEALVAGRPAIILCPHVGSWELAGMFCAAHGGITSLYKPQKGGVDALVKRGRERLGARLVSSDGGGVRALLASLRRGERVGILPDQDPPPGAGAFAPFFGHPAHTPTLVNKLAQRTGAVIVYCYAERVGASGFRLHIVPAPAAGESLAALNASVERCVLHLPGQYWWSYKRFRRQPEGAIDFYRGDPPTADERAGKAEPPAASDSSSPASRAQARNVGARPAP